ncbi:MAG TPA: gliding motility-associated C-terminal domain-containing protein [Chitinophagales bacterium]|nr:gliding motility-associated C-terminal domain-containing protein [Chitinophagales bacterium]
MVKQAKQAYFTLSDRMSAIHFLRKIFYASGFVLLVVRSQAQTYYHPDAGIQNTYAGDCEVNTCGGTYVDDGGNGKYSNGINAIYRTFCPDAPGKCIRLTFTYFDVEPAGFFGCYDYLEINNGPTQNSPNVWTGCGTTTPPLITSTDPSGCITVRFTSDATFNAGGWSATISCVTCSGNSPNAALNNDCSNAQFVCDNLQTITANSEGPGLTSDACVSGCAISENYSNWYVLNVTQAGTLGLTIDPTPNPVDYDFTLYGPVTGGCANLGAPIRCSYAANTGNTGMNAGSSDVSEDVTGDGWVSMANVSVGTYYLLVNQWSYQANSKFQLDFSGTAIIGLPSPVISSNSPVCANKILQLNGPNVPGAVYHWSGPGGWTSNQQNPIRNPPVDGTYSFYYTVNGCNSTTVTTSVTVNPAPTPSISPVSPTLCSGQSATLMASGGGTYAWNNSATTASIIVSPASTTTYTVTVTNANGCSASASNTVSVTAGLTASISPATASICNGQIITLTASGGTNYSWSNSATTASITVNPATNTTYSVTVSNGGSCTASSSRTVTVNANPAAAISPTALSICSGENATLTASGGASFLWSNSASTASITVNPLSTTVYSVTVTDANGCTATASRTVNVSPSLTASIAPSSPAICSGESISLSASGGTSFSWSTSETTATITVNPVSTTVYFVTVTDGGACSATSSQTVTVHPAATASVSPAATAVCEGTGVSFIASGGTSYVWSNSGTTASISVTPVSTSIYTVTVTDANGCTASSSGIVTVNPNPVASVSSAIVTICEGLSATLTAGGGNSYLWSTSETSANITVSPTLSTTYWVTVSDANNCSATTSSTVYVNGNPAPAISPATSNVCSGANVTLAATGGYTYLWSNAATGASITVNPFVTTNYTVTATDGNGCTGMASAVVNVTPSITLSATVTHVACNGENSGAVYLSITGGLAPFVFAWSNNATTQNILNVPAGNYSVTVSDNAGCGAMLTEIISEPAMLNVSEAHQDVSCSGYHDGVISISVTGGAAPYIFSWNDGDASQNRSNLSAGNYSVTVSDNHSCASVLNVTIAEPAPLTISEFHGDVACSGGTSGSIDLIVSGGTAPYSFRWNDGAMTEDRSSLSSSTYSVTVTDNHSCAESMLIVVGSASGITATETHTSASCSGAGDAVIDVTVSGGVPPYAYLWNDGATTQDRSSIAAGNYSLTITDNNSCVHNLSVSIIEPGEIVLTTASTDVSCYGGNDGSILVSVNGGTAPYSFTWNDGATSQDRNFLAGGNYSVSVTDYNSCTASSSSTIIEPPEIMLFATEIHPTCAGNSADGSIALTVTGGSPPYQFVWSDGSTAGSIANLAPGNYSVTVTDASGCSATNFYTLSYQYDFGVEASPSVTIVTGSSTTLSYTLTGFAGSFTPSWTPSQSLSCGNCESPIASPPQSTLYTIRVTNESGCSSSDTVTVHVMDEADVFTPNVFTPNGDNMNDEFRAFGSLEAAEFFQVQIFNRWGELLFESFDKNFKWDGTYRGEKLNPGVYVYQIKTSLRNGKPMQVMTGSVTLMR